MDEPTIAGRPARARRAAPLPHASKHTSLREVLLAADHDAYHLGQVVELRRRLGA